MNNTKTLRGTIIYELFGGEMRMVTQARNPELRNFVICCPYGDWGGYRTLDGCREQFPSLLRQAAKRADPDGYFWVEER